LWLLNLVLQVFDLLLPLGSELLLELFLFVPSLLL